MPRSHQVPYSLVPYACIFIDSSWRQFWTTITNCLFMRTSCDLRRKLCDEITSLFIRPSNTSPAFVCLSVRTGFDLFFRTMRFARGSEVIVSAVNIPGMIDIIREHGLVPVPWDIDVDTLSPKLNLLDTLITSRSVAVVVSHLFGKRCSNVDAAIRKARTHGLYFVEDCAEIFHGFEYLGHPDSDLAMFSFGAMKHFTTFGGAVCKVRDRGLHDAMTELYSLDPEQSRLDYLKKVCTTFLVAVGVNVPVVMRVGVPTSNLFGIDYKERAVQLLRGFPPGEDLWNRLRQQPSIPALILMRDRLRTATSADLRKTKEKGDFVRRLLPDGVSLPGRLVSGHDWLFPIVVNDAEAVAKRLNAIGVDAVIKATQLTVVNGDTKDTAEDAHRLLSHIVYLPVHKNVPYESLRRICKAVGVAVSSDPECLQKENRKSWCKSKL